MDRAHVVHDRRSLRGELPVVAFGACGACGHDDCNRRRVLVWAETPMRYGCSPYPSGGAGLSGTFLSLCDDLVPKMRAAADPNEHTRGRRVGRVDAAAVAVLPPADGRGRGYGAWWVRRRSDRLSEIAHHLVRLASSIPGLSLLQVSRPADEAVGDPRFVPVYPLWTMIHDGATWPQPSGLPAPLRQAEWSDVVPGELRSAYDEAYRDQRVVEPHEPSIGERHADVSALAVGPDGRVAGFVLGFIQDDGGVELGPIGTVSSWRRRGVSSALLASVLKDCRELGPSHSQSTATVRREHRAST